MLNIITNRIPHELTLVEVKPENEPNELINITIDCHDGHFCFNGPIKQGDIILVVAGEIKVTAGTAGITVDLTQVTKLWVDDATANGGNVFCG